MGLDGEGPIGEGASIVGDKIISHSDISAVDQEQDTDEPWGKLIS